MSTRTQDTVYVFYVKAEQTDAHEIIQNQVSIISVILICWNERTLLVIFDAKCPHEKHSPKILSNMKCSENNERPSLSMVLLLNNINFVSTEERRAS